MAIVALIIALYGARFSSMLNNKCFNGLPTDVELPTRPANADIVVRFAILSAIAL